MVSAGGSSALVEGAVRFYARAGYAERGRLPGLVLADVDELIYHKRLR